MNAKKKPPVLSRKSRELLEGFADAAMTWGWERDQGSGPSVAHSEAVYKATKAALEEHMLSLQAKRKGTAR